MNRHTTRLTRFAGSLAGLLLVLAVGAMPVLAAPGTGPSATVADPAVQLNDRARCAEAWRAAAANPTVETYQAVGLCEIDRRLATIDRLDGAIEASRALTDGHQAALQAILDASQGGLQALRADIEADTTLAELREDIDSIFEDYRIYVLVTRQVWLVTAADTVDVAGAALSDTATDLASLIEQAQASGKDVTQATAHLAAMETAIDEALASVDGVAADVLALTPADWNADTAEPILRAARQAIVGARADLRTALREARRVIAALA